MPSDDRLNELIEQITVDAYGNEGYWSFLQAFEDEGRFPVAASLAGLPVTITGVDFDGDARRGLVAIIELNDRSHRVSLLDVEPAAELDVALLLAAYKRWLGSS